MKVLKKALCTVLTITILITGFVACGSSDQVPVNTKTGTYDEMVEYLTAKGYIAEGTVPVDINSTEGYVQDNTGGEMPIATVADRAEDYDGLWLIWFDVENNSELYQSNFSNAAMTGGTIIISGGACVLQTAAYSGSFAIAFAEDYDQVDAVIADFNALPKE